MAHIGVDMTGQTSEPGFHSVDGFADAGEVAALHGLFDQAQAIFRDAGIVVPYRDRRGDIGLADQIGAQLLQRGIGIEGFVRRVGIHQHRRFVGHHLLEDRHDGFALGEPLAADAPQNFGRVGLVETDGAGDPAIGKGEAVQIVEQARPGLRGKAHDRQRAKMRLSKPRLQSAHQILVGQNRVEMHRNVGQAHTLLAGGYAGMQIGERAGVVEPAGLRHEAFDEREHAIGAIDESGKRTAPVGAFMARPS